MAKEFTEREKAFIRAYKRFFPHPPSDWAEGDIARGTSSFIDVSEWLTQSHATIEQITAGIGDVASGGEKRPSLAQIANAVRKRMAATPAGDARMPRCGLCQGTGFVLVVCDFAAGNGGKVLPAREIIPAKRAGTNAIPCRCSVGLKKCEHYHQKPHTQEQVSQGFATQFEARAHANACQAAGDAQGANYQPVGEDYKTLPPPEQEDVI